jgi:hypothetical protein
MPSRLVRAGLILHAVALLSACSADDLDCSLGAIKPTCPPGTLGFDRMEDRVRLAERACLKAGLQPDGDAYAACIAKAAPTPKARQAPLNALFGSEPR